LRKIELTLVGLGAALIAVSVHANDRALPVIPELKTSAVQPSQGEMVPPEAKPAAAAPVRAVDGLSPGNRLIAQALYNAQKAVTMSGLKAWSLDSVASARSAGRNWGEVFQQMKREGLLEAETLGQVVTWYQYHQATAPRVAPPQPATLTGVSAVAPRSAP
jgi:hypothetical protein